MTSESSLLTELVTDLRGEIRALRKEVHDVALKIAKSEDVIPRLQKVEDRMREIEAWQSGAKVRLAMVGGGSGLGLAGLYELLKGFV